MESFDAKFIASILNHPRNLTEADHKTISSFIFGNWLPRWKTTFDITEFIHNLSYVQYSDDVVIYEENSKIEHIIYLIQGVVNLYRRNQPPPKHPQPVINKKQQQSLESGNKSFVLINRSSYGAQQVSQSLNKHDHNERQDSPKLAFKPLPKQTFSENTPNQKQANEEETFPYGSFVKQIGVPASIGENVFTSSLNRHYTGKSQGLIKCCKIPLSLARRICGQLVQQNAEFDRRMAEYLGLSLAAISKYQLYRYFRHKQLPLREKLVAEGERKKDKNSIYFILSGQIKMSKSVPMNDVQAAGEPQEYSSLMSSPQNNKLARVNWSYVPKHARNEHLLNLGRFDFAGVEILYGEEYKYTYTVSTSTATFFEIFAKDVQNLPIQFHNKLQEAFTSHSAAIARKTQFQSLVLNKGIIMNRSLQQGVRDMSNSYEKRKPKKDTQQLKKLKLLCMHVPKMGIRALNEYSVVNSRQYQENQGPQKKLNMHSSCTAEYMENLARKKQQSINSISTPYISLVPNRKERKVKEVEMKRKNWDHYLKLPALQE